MQDLLMGVDVGTTGCKVITFSPDGRAVKQAYREYPLYSPQPGWRELDANEVLAAVYACISECTAGAEGARVKGIACSAQGEAVIPVGKDGRPLARAMVSMDVRDIGEVDWVRQNMDVARLQSRTGVPLHTMFSLPKILWYKRNMPDVYAKTWKFMCFADFVAFSLGAPPVMDYALASRTMLFSPTAQKWDAELAAEAGIDLAKLPDVEQCGTCIGNVNDAARTKFGFAKDCALCAGGHDQVCCALGAGVLEGGEAMDSNGTTDSILCVAREFSATPAQMAANIPCGSFSVPGLFAKHSFNLSTGSIMQWFRNTFRGKDFKYSALDVEAEALGEPSPVLLIPHFAGAGTPTLNSRAAGWCVGLTTETTQAQLYRAVLEGIGFDLRLNIENLENSGSKINVVKAIGGSAKSDFYMQLKADIFGKPIVRMKVDEAGCLGAALLAGVGCGAIAVVKNAVSRFTSEDKTFTPDAARRAQYDKGYTQYKLLTALEAEYYKES
jgi:xylulokinase